MSHKTFISYKYDEAQGLRDRIIESLGEDAVFYKGETSNSPDLTDTTTENIKKNLADMMYDTSVTIVIVSPNMKNSKWIDWEIEYSLKNNTRKDRTSHTNGVVGVIMNINGNDGWLRSSVQGDDGCTYSCYNDWFLYNIIKENRFNQDPKVYSCLKCKTVNELTGSYISLVSEEAFLNNPQKYIDNAYDKSENDAVGYTLVKTK